MSICCMGIVIGEWVVRVKLLFKVLTDVVVECIFFIRVSGALISVVGIKFHNLVIRLR